MKTQTLFHKSIAEFIGTFTLVFCGCGALMIAGQFPGQLSLSAIPFIFGLAVMIMIYALGHISGAYFNPAVTLGFAAARHFPKGQVLAYWAAQFLGAFAAMAFLRFLLPQAENFGATLPHVSVFRALIGEGVFTFLLMFVIMAVATDTRAEGTMAGAAIGAVVMLGAFVAGPVTGASMNPARSLAPAIFQGTLETLWIYFLGPCAGALTAALLYEWVRCEKKTEETAKGCC